MKQSLNFQNCYGRSDPAAVQCVKDVYNELNIKKVFKAYEEESYADLVGHIRQIPGEGKVLPPAVFNIFLDKIYKRNA